MFVFISISLCIRLCIYIINSVTFLKFFSHTYFLFSQCLNDSLSCQQVHNATAVFIINLTLSDLMFGVFNLPLAASLFVHRAWVHTGFLCLLFPFLRYGLVAVSVFTVLAITINRYVMIAHPRLYHR